MLVLDFPRGDRCSDADWWPTVNAFEAALKRNAARGAIVASMTENLPESHAEALFARGIVPLQGIAEALDAAEAAAFIGAAWQAPVPAPVAGGKAAAAGGRRVPDEADAKAMLAAAGLPVPAGRRVADAEAAVRAAEVFGYPVVLKALGLAHKSEHGAVRLCLRRCRERARGGPRPGRPRQRALCRAHGGGRRR